VKPHYCQPATATIAIRTRGGRLIGYYDPHTGCLYVRDGKVVDVVELRAVVLNCQGGEVVDVTARRVV
jgi:hypothetical protein